MDAPTAEFKVEKRSVNNKTLCEQLQKEVESLIVDAGVLWSSDVHREGFVETIQDYLENFADETQKIDQWDAKCDMRNNTVEQIDKGIYTFEFNYRQTNCLNTTRLIYTVKDMLVSSLKELLDLDLSTP